MKKKFQSLCEVKISYRTTGVKHIKVNGSHSAEKILRELYPVDIEHREAFVVLLMNRANETLGVYTVSIGGVSGTVADSKLIFQSAIKCNASSIILCHNHPSGNLKPSDTDITLTKKIREGGKLLDIDVLDHLILTKTSYHSFADNGEMN